MQAQRPAFLTGWLIAYMINFVVLLLITAAIVVFGFFKEQEDNDDFKWNPIRKSWKEIHDYT